MASAWRAEDGPGDEELLRLVFRRDADELVAVMAAGRRSRELVGLG